MGYLVLENFQGGLDTRKARLAAPAGTLTEAMDGHITQGGEFEKRKAFVALVNPDGVTETSLPANTFGLQPVTGGLLVFGSIDPSGLQWPEDADGNAITYQRLQHPAVLAGETYAAGSHAMTGVITSEVFGGKAWVVAEFADGRSFCYYDGALVADFTAGLVLPYLAGNNRKIARHMQGLVDAFARYSAALVGPYATTHRAHAGTTATLTIGTHRLEIGNKIWVSGMSSNYNVAGGAITGKTATTISYTTAGSLTEGTTADTSGTVESAVLEIDGAAGVDYSVAVNNTTSGGTVSGPTNTISAVAAVTGVEARGAFTVTGGSDIGVTPTAATGTITRTATNASAADYIQIGKKKYTFRTTLAVEGDVKIGATAADTLTNLQRAINHTGTPGTDYICALAHPWVRAGNISGSNLPLTAFHGKHGSTIALSESTGTARFSVTAFSGGAGNCVASIKVVSPSGTETELLSGAVAFTINASGTAAAVRDNIAAFSGTSGYTATVNENTVTILSSDTANPMPNGYHLQVATGGDVLIGECLFYLTQQATAFTLNTVQVDGLDCLGGAQLFPNVPIDTLPEYYAELVRVINLRTGITGINAWTEGSYVKLSRISTRDDDQPLTVYITPALANTVGIVFGTPPPLALALKVVLPDNVTTLANAAKLASPSASVSMTAAATATVTGGNGLYTYEWVAEYPGTETGQLSGYAYIIANGLVQPQYGSFQVIYSIARANDQSRQNQFVFNLTPYLVFPTLSGFGIDVQPFVVRYLVRCRVTDSAGNVATSNVCAVEFQIT